MTEMTGEPTIHASAVLVGARAVLIRGPSGSGKSRLALGILELGLLGPVGGGFSRLVGDDRVHIEAVHGRLLVRPAEVLAGLIEVRGLGILRKPYEPLAQVGLVVDLGAADADRMPAPSARMVDLAGVMVQRLPVAAGMEPLPLVLAVLSGTPQID